jgi:hypothetical protein
MKSFFFTAGCNEAELLIKLRSMVAIAADDTKDHFCKVPVHVGWFIGLLAC